MTTYLSISRISEDSSDKHKTNSKLRTAVHLNYRQRYFKHDFMIFSEGRVEYWVIRLADEEFKKKMHGYSTPRRSLHQKSTTTSLNNLE